MFFREFASIVRPEALMKLGLRSTVARHGCGVGASQFNLNALSRINQLM
jgi:hypothetical protein